MHLLPIDLSHQDLLNEKFKRLNLDISEYSFANIYLFRHIHHYQLFYAHDLFIKGITREGESFLMPLDPLSEENIHHLIPLLEEVDFLFPIAESQLKFFNLVEFQKYYSENDSDYVFLKTSLNTYSGSHLDSKKNLVKQLFENHRVEALPLTSAEVPDALSILETWMKESSEESDETDYNACKEALRHMLILQLNGYIVYVDDQPAGFIIGEKLTQNSYVIHFAKGIKSVKGIYQYLYQWLASQLEEDIVYINMEQDLGSPQLRQSKHSYHPHHMIHKWRVSPKNET